MKKADQKSFTLTFPEEYHAKELEGKPITFHATITKVEEVKLPELTDAFVRENLGADSATDLRRRVRESMVREEERLERQRREQLLMDEIRKATHVDLAPELVQEEAQALLEEMEEDLKKRGHTITEWLKSTGKKPEEVQKEFEERARQRLTLRLGIRELVDSRNIIVPDAEIEAAITELLAPLSEKERQQYEPAYRKGEKAYEQLLWQKKVEKLFEEMLK
jgi:trigger factor